MAVIVTMCVFVLEHFVAVSVLVSFGQMQVRAQGEEGHGEHAAPAERTITEEPGDQCTHEWREGKDRGRARRADSSLRLEVQSQAEPVADRADEQQEQGSRRRAWRGFAQGATERE